MKTDRTDLGDLRRASPAENTISGARMGQGALPRRRQFPLSGANILPYYTRHTPDCYTKSKIFCKIKFYDAERMPAGRIIRRREKISRRKTEYLLSGGEDWPAEFRRFTADKSNYIDTLILLSGGEYSAVPAGELGLSEAEWRGLSLTIRKYHELTHFICRGLRPQDVDAIRDEIIADMIGLVAAFGRYDAALARRFLGIDGGNCRPGGRLAHYVTPEALDEAAERARALTEEYAGKIEPLPKTDPIGLLTQVF